MNIDKNDTKTAVGFFVSVILGLVIGTCASFFFHPQQETLTCSKNYECEFERKYYGFIKYVKKIKISPKTLYLPDVKTHLKLKNARLGTTSEDGIEYYHIYSDNQNINIKFKNYIHLSGASAFEITETDERNQFEKYKENPEYYSVKSSLLIDDRINDFKMKSILSLFASVLIVALLFSIL